MVSNTEVESQIHHEVLTQLKKSLKYVRQEESQLAGEFITPQGESQQVRKGFKHGR